MSEKAKELINLLYTDNLTQFGKRQLADMIEKQQTQINSLINKEETAVVEPNYKEEYYKLQEENCMLKGKIKEYQEALLRICISK